jgi:hypothetical protein
MRDFRQTQLGSHRSLQRSCVWRNVVAHIAPVNGLAIRPESVTRALSRHTLLTR